MEKMPTIVLGNGLKVANFSSPHTFTFDTGEVLPACSSERAESLMLKATEVEITHPKWVDIDLNFEMSPAIADAHTQACLQAVEEGIDIVLVPFPVMKVFRESLYSRPEDIMKSPFRVIRSADRVTKSIYSSRFCI